MSEDESQVWRLGTFQGLRQEQHESFRKLSLREKVKRLEEMAEVAAALSARVKAPRARVAQVVRESTNEQSH